MASLTLGLDLGPSSIGWALLDEENTRIVAAGVRVFPEGVDRDQTGGELSKSAARRVARGMRRQAARRSRRKKLLREALVACGLLPSGAEEQRQLDGLNPYELRAKGLDEPLSRYEFGRVLLHLNQRRGFLSNRKADKGKQKENSETLASIGQLAESISAGGFRTLGEYLHDLYQKSPLERLRKKHTRRSMFQDEFEQLWLKQKTFHSSLLTDELKYGTGGRREFPCKPGSAADGAKGVLKQFGLHGIIFFQRPMYWPMSVVGKCELNPKERRCQRAHRLAQRFRILVEVNNLKIISEGEILDLTAEQRSKVISLLERKKDVTFDDLRRHLKLLESAGFNLEAGDRRKLKGMETDVLLSHKSLFGKSWFDRGEDEKTQIVEQLLDVNDPEKEQAVALRAVQEWGMTKEQAEDLLSLNFPDGYASYSRSTLRKLLPHIEKGMPLMRAPGETCAIRAAGFLPPYERTRAARTELPQPPELTNPLVRQSLHEVRKVVNAIIREYGVPKSIHVELAREVKGNGVARARLTAEMRSRERERERVAGIIAEDFGVKPTRKAIERYLLWIEQDQRCIYSGKPISQNALYGGEVDVDHILPYSRSLDDSRMNKVLCFQSENHAKSNQTPYEWLAGTNPEKYERVLQRAAKLPIDIRNRKLPRFSQKSCELLDFINRHLTDTSYITAAVLDYLRWLGCDLLAGKGAITAELRHRWGLNSILNQEGLELKNREDHRHHAVDAIVIALTNHSRLQLLARERGKLETTPPWKGFRENAAELINTLRVSHRARRKIAGALHEDTIYGPTQRAGEFVFRKGIADLKGPMIEQIRDQTIRSLVLDRLLAFDIDPTQVSSIPKEVWKEPLRMPSGVTVNKVRLLKRDETIRQLREDDEGRFVKPGSNHHVCIFEVTDSNGKTRREPIWVSMLEATKRLKEKQSIINRNHPTNPRARFVMSLSRGEMVLAELKGVERLVVYRTGASTQGQLYFVEHTDARQDKTIKKFAATANSLKGRKVTVNSLGQLRWAND